DYGTTSWLAFYLPRGTCVQQQSQRIRWINMSEPDPKLLAGKALFVDELRTDGHPFLNDIVWQVTRVAELTRKRGPLVVETYGIDLLEGAKRDVLDRSPPPELQK
ncbi:MAG: glycosyl transferase, partial [Bradyrhizobium guangdongense]